ncbi:MAG: MMPL family transporter, partial [Gaiellaceae bacterium]
MSPLKHSTNVAARMGRWSARHRKIAIWGWLAFVIASFVVGMAVGLRTIDESDYNVGEARGGDHIIRDGGFAVDEQSEFVLVESETANAKDPEFRAVVGDALATLDGFPQVTKVQSPYAAGNEGQISKDGHAVLIQFTPKGSFEEATLYIDEITDATAEIQADNPDYYVGQAGSASTGKALEELFASQLARAGLLSIPLTLIILLVVFRSLVGASVPLLLALTSVFATMGLVALPSLIVPMDESISEVILLIGLAVGVDYSLFYIRRERDERRAGRSESAALEAAAATSGRAVLISGITVMIAMAGMFFSGDKTFMSFAIGTMMVVAVAMIGSLTVLPAVLSWLGDRVEKVRVPFLGRTRGTDGEGRVWGAILDRVLRRPLVSAVASAAVLVVLAVPALSLNPAQSGLDALPASLEEVQSYNRIDDVFPGGATPAVVAIAGDASSSELQVAVRDLRTQALASGQALEPIDVVVAPGGKALRVEIPLVGKGTDDESNTALATLREELVPATLGRVDGIEYAVTGSTAASKDWNDAMKSAVP